DRWARRGVRRMGRRRRRLLGSCPDAAAVPLRPPAIPPPVASAPDGEDARQGFSRHAAAARDLGHSHRRARRGAPRLASTPDMMAVSAPAIAAGELPRPTMGTLVHAVPSWIRDRVGAGNWKDVASRRLVWSELQRRCEVVYFDEKDPESLLGL